MVEHSTADPYVPYGRGGAGNMRRIRISTSPLHLLTLRQVAVLPSAKPGSRSLPNPTHTRLPSHRALKNTTQIQNPSLVHHRQGDGEARIAVRGVQAQLASIVPRGGGCLRGTVLRRRTIRLKSLIRRWQSSMVVCSSHGVRGSILLYACR